MPKKRLFLLEINFQYFIIIILCCYSFRPSVVRLRRTNITMNFISSVDIDIPEPPGALPLHLAACGLRFQLPAMNTTGLMSDVPVIRVKGFDKRRYGVYLSVVPTKLFLEYPVSYPKVRIL